MTNGDLQIPAAALPVAGGHEGAGPWWRSARTPRAGSPETRWC
jgi:hypothetical protein